MNTRALRVLEFEKIREQLSLFASENENHDKSESVERTMDEIRRKFGNGSIKFGRVIGNDIGVDL